MPSASADGPGLRIEPLEVHFKDDQPAQRTISLRVRSAALRAEHATNGGTYISQDLRAAAALPEAPSRGGLQQRLQACAHHSHDCAFAKLGC